MVIKMKRITKNGTILAVMALMVLATIMGALAAPPLPYPVFGKVTIVGDLVPLFEVKMSTCDYGSTAINCFEDVVSKFDTDSTGSFVFALDNINPMYRTRTCNNKGICYTGDFIKIKVCDNHPNCEIIRELKGSFMEINFDLGVNKEVIIEKETVEVEKIVEVPEKTKEGEDIGAVVAGEPTTLERIKSLGNLWWVAGFVAMVLVLMGTQYNKAKKMLATLIKKHNKKGYGK